MVEAGEAFDMDEPKRTRAEAEEQEQEQANKQANRQEEKGPSGSKDGQEGQDKTLKTQDPKEETKTKIE